MASFRVRRRLRRCCLILFVLCLPIGLIVVNSIYSLYNSYNCHQNIETATNEICSGYLLGKSVGTFCRDLCEGSKAMRITGCPNILWHNGKDYVFTATWGPTKVVLKARGLSDRDMVGGSPLNQQVLQPRDIVKGLEDVVEATFAFNSPLKGHLNKLRFKARDLIPWNWSGSENMSSFNKTALLNLWLLSQDNEYILSKILGDSNHTKDHLVFPRILGTCGHFYAVEYSDDILDFSYIVPRSARFFSQTFDKRVGTALALIQFLRTLETLETGLELCDVKFEHFGVFRDVNHQEMLLMIDSDMIYHNQTAVETIEAIKVCSDDSDCEFIDCEGICVRINNSSTCRINNRDDNLKRICRNMLFMGKFNLIGYKTRMGLLPNAPLEYKSRIEIIKDVCFNESSQLSLSEKIEIVYNTLQVLSKQILSR